MSSFLENMKHDFNDIKQAVRNVWLNIKLAKMTEKYVLSQPGRVLLIEWIQEKHNNEDDEDRCVPATLSFIDVTKHFDCRLQFSVVDKSELSKPADSRSVLYCESSCLYDEPYDNDSFVHKVWNCISHLFANLLFGLFPCIIRTVFWHSCAMYGARNHLVPNASSPEELLLKISIALEGEC